MCIPIDRALGVLYIGQLNLLSAHDPIIGAHDSGAWCKEDGKGVVHDDECCCLVNELSWLDNLLRSVVPYKFRRKDECVPHTQPARDKRDDSTSAYVYLGRDLLSRYRPRLHFRRYFRTSIWSQIREQGRSQPPGPGWILSIIHRHQKQTVYNLELVTTSSTLCPSTTEVAINGKNWLTRVDSNGSCHKYFGKQP